MKLLIINGPNINLLGVREPQIYGSRSYSELESYIRNECEKYNAECRIFQSNHEGDIVDEIQAAYGVFDGIVINAAAYTHTSIAIADALRAVNIPSVEVHLSDTSAREEYRHVSYLRPVCAACFSGRGFDSYGDAVSYLCGGKEVCRKQK